MKDRRRLALVIAGLSGALLFVVGISNLATAAEPASDPITRESITLSPVSKRYQVDAGTIKTDELTIVNDGAVAYDFIVYARPYSVNDSSYEADFTAQKPNADAYQWVQFDQSRYNIEAGATIKVKYTLRVPQNASPGGHYGVLFAETQPKTQEGTAVVRKKRVGSLVYATVNGEYQLEGNHEKTVLPFWQTRPPLIAVTTVKNTGNTDFISKLGFKVSDVFGNLKFSEEKEYAVLPETTRDMRLEWGGAPWFGLFRAEVKTTFLDKPTVTTSGFVLLLPRWLAIVVGVVIVGGVGYAILRRRR